tara:strand:- start:831 stop:1007 length:177 start_codon:yes stop_codon:yes gene_type:complete
MENQRWLKNTFIATRKKKMMRAVAPLAFAKWRKFSGGMKGEKLSRGSRLVNYVLVLGR